LVLALIFGIMLLILGFKHKVFFALAGPCWILMGIAIFKQYDEAFMYMSVGLGMIVFAWGAYDALV
jgi:hypothetical protein